MTGVDAIAAAALALIAGTVWAALRTLLAGELTGALADRGRRQLRAAADRLPADVRERWLGEWLAEYEQLASRPIKAFLYASDVRRNAATLEVELREDSERRDSVPSVESFPSRLRALRKAQGLSQEALGRASGISRNHLGAIERGHRDPKIGTLLHLARGLGVSMNELIDGLDDDPPRR